MKMPRGVPRPYESRLFRISESTFNSIEDWIRASEIAKRNIEPGLDNLASLLAHTNQAFAMEYSAGPVDPRQRGTFTGHVGKGSGPGVTHQSTTSVNGAWKIPVRRITGKYYASWKVKRIRRGTWALINASREAYFIEYGINHVGTTKVITYRGGKTFLRGPRRVRRPIQKLSLMKTMKFAEQTDVAGRIWSQMFAPFYPGKEVNSRAGAFVGEGVQAVPGMRFI